MSISQTASTFRSHYSFSYLDYTERIKAEQWKEYISQVILICSFAEVKFMDSGINGKIQSNIIFLPGFSQAIESMSPLAARITF